MDSDTGRGSGTGICLRQAKILIPKYINFPIQGYMVLRRCIGILCIFHHKCQKQDMFF